MLYTAIEDNYPKSGSFEPDNFKANYLIEIDSGHRSSGDCEGRTFYIFRPLFSTRTDDEAHRLAANRLSCIYWMA